MRKILVSACLLGQRVRHDNKRLPYRSSILQKWERKGYLIPICPEVEGGLPVPRPASEIQDGDGRAVLANSARIINAEGELVTHAFILGARAALWLARENGVKAAILKSRSPSCGNEEIYDGKFSGRLRRGQGITAALLELNGIKVFNEDEIDQVARYLQNAGELLTGTAPC